MNLENVKTTALGTGFLIVVLGLWLIPPNVDPIERASEGVYLRHLKTKEDSLDLQRRKQQPNWMQLAGEETQIHMKRLALEREWGVTVSKEDGLELKAELDAEQRQKAQDDANAAEFARLLNKCANLEPHLQDACIGLVLNMSIQSPVVGASQACLAMQKDPDLHKVCDEEQKTSSK